MIKFRHIFNIFWAMIISFNLQAASGPFATIVLGPSYGVTAHGSTNSSTGAVAGMDIGYSMGSVDLDLIFRKIALSNKMIGDDSYNSTIDDFIYGVGLRSIIGSLLTVKAGFAIHDIETSVEQDGSTETSREFKGNDLGLYAGMGWFNKISEVETIFVEGVFYRANDADISFINFEFGFKRNF